MRVGAHEVLCLATPTHWDSYIPPGLVIIHVIVHIDIFFWGCVSQPEDIWSVYSFMEPCTWHAVHVHRKVMLDSVGLPCSEKNHLVKSETQQIQTSKALSCDTSNANLHQTLINLISLLLCCLYSSIKSWTACPWKKSNLRWKNTEVN